MDKFETPCTSFGKCTKCRDLIPEIGSLPGNEFNFHWKPYLRGVPPLRIVFLGWEPASPSWSGPRGAVEEGSFSEPLLFAIREFLLFEEPKAGFLIANMAQCSMKTVELCRKTRGARYEACSEFLKELVLLARGEAREIAIVSIGQEPKFFLDNHPDVLKPILGNFSIHSITHYSKGNPHFNSFAKDRSHEFDAFSESILPRYEEFIRLEEFQDYWQKEYSPHPARSTQDLKRIFKWKYEMAGIRLSSHL
jgi:hypothetical protein